MALVFDLSKVVGFEWDKGNLNKNRLKHNVDPKECEELFYNKPLLISSDKAHSQVEERFKALGQTSNGRLILIAFTVRGGLIRVISARDRNKKEREIYQNLEDKNL